MVEEIVVITGEEDGMITEVVDITESGIWMTTAQDTEETTACIIPDIVKISTI